MLTTLATIPLQLVVQLIVPGNIESGNNTQALGPPLLNQTPELPEGYTAFPDVGMAYKHYNRSRVTWNYARRRCTADGANLAVIDSYKKNEYVTGLIEDHDPLCPPWVGIHRLFDGIEWVSLKNASPTKMIPWATGDTGEAQQDNKCIVLYGDGSGAVAKPCHYNFFFVCEIEIPHSLESTQELIAN